MTNYLASRIKKRKNRNILIILKLLVVISAFFTFILCTINSGKIVNGFNAIMLLPLFYLLFFLIIVQILELRSSSCKITVTIYLLIQWLRMVLLPLVGIISGYFSFYGSHIDENTAELSVILLVYESILSGLFCCIILHFKSHHTEYNGKIKLKGTNFLYIVFIIFGVILFFSSGANQFQFFALNVSGERVSNDIAGDVGSGLDAIVSYALTFLVIIILYKNYKMYQKSKKAKYMYFALIFAMVRLCIISSEGRMSQIYLLGTFLIVLPKLFPEYKQKIRSYIIIVAVAVLGLMTVYKTFYAFLYNSYLEAIRANSVDLTLLSSQIDIYFYGVKTVARNLTYCQQTNVSLFQPIFDILRSIFGVHYFFKGMGSTTVELYNMYIYGDSTTSGHLFSSIAYGYLYFGAILAPIATCFNIFVSSFIENIIKSIKHIDILYIASLVFIRISITVFSNFSPSLSVISRTIIIGGIVIGCSSLIKNRKNIYVGGNLSSENITSI